MRLFYVIVTKSTRNLYYVEVSTDPKFPKGRWSFSIYDAYKFDSFKDAEFERLALGLREAVVEEHA